jgi:hypothetical protein
MTLKRQSRTRYDDTRAVIAAHRVEGNSYASRYHPELAVLLLFRVTVPHASKPGAVLIATLAALRLRANPFCGIFMRKDDQITISA